MSAVPPARTALGGRVRGIERHESPNLFGVAEDRRGVDAAAGEAGIGREQRVGALERSRCVAGVERHARRIDEHVERIVTGRHASLLPEIYQGSPSPFHGTIRRMKKLLLLIVVAGVAGASRRPRPDKDVAGWEKQAQGITITRDDWGIPHVSGKTDADAVFGVMYAQAEDDFNRVETNYLNSIGRLAEAEGEAEIYRDLRMKLFIDPADMKAQYQKSPEWLKKLMNAWADGLNYYLYKHPQVKPRVITHFEPWMALTFSEGSIGGDIERVNLNQLEAFYGKTPLKATSAATSWTASSSRPARTASRSRRPTPRRTTRCC